MMFTPRCWSRRSAASQALNKAFGHWHLAKEELAAKNYEWEEAAKRAGMPHILEDM